MTKARPDPARAKAKVQAMLDAPVAVRGPAKVKAISQADEFANVTTASAIMGMPEREAAACVPERVPAGLVVVGGRPKAKKSWLLLQLGIAKAAGTMFLGKPVPQGRTLLIQLEDNARRGRKRFAFYGINEASQAPEKLHICYQWPSGKDGIAKLDRWMELNPDTALIGIDVLQRMRGPKDRGASVYDADYEYMGFLHTLTTKYPGLTIVVIHHIKKGEVSDPVEAINGSFGIAGAADAYIILRKHDDTRWIAHIDGRDWESWDHEFLWEFQQSVGWVQLGTNSGDLTGRQAEITRLARDRGGITPQELGQHFNITRQSAAEALRALTTKGFLYSTGGKYRASTTTVP